jgi:outer membrane protein OmpA-like peptidoglycan-associated protein
MKQQHSLDHDGLDGILQSSPKPKSSSSKLLWLLPILILIAGGTFWLQKNRPINPSQPSARQENLPASSESDRITIASNEAPVASVPTQDVQPLTAVPPDNVPLTGTGLAVPPLPDNARASQSPAALDNKIPQVLESAQSDQSTTAKPPAIASVTVANAEKNTDQSTNAVMSQNSKINFKYASSKVHLTKTQKTELTRLLKECNNPIEITGYTCNQGSPDHNQQLGLARAHALKRLLIRIGVPAEKIITASKGMQSPIASNETLPGRALNRRAELVCKGKTQ